jgi:hypothetical protein
MPFFTMFVDPPSTLYKSIYRLFHPSHPADRMNVLLLKYSMYGDLSDDGLRFYKDDIAEIQKIVPKVRRLIGTFQLLAQKLVFCKLGSRQIA